jgi:hypothetical protein
MIRAVDPLRIATAYLNCIATAISEYDVRDLIVPFAWQMAFRTVDL